MSRVYRTEKMVARLSGGTLAHRLGFSTVSPANGVTISGRGYGYLIVQTIKAHMISARPELVLADVPVIEALKAVLPEQELAFRHRIFGDAVKVWRDMCDPASDMPLTHDGYLKLWCLRRPRIAGNYILLDEAQDTNEVVLDLVRHQHMQTIIVGDQFQALYGWRGAVNAMQNFTVRHHTKLTQSWRFGPEIAAMGSRVLSLLGESSPLRGDPHQAGRVGVVDDPDVILARTNAQCIMEVLSHLDAGRRPALVGGTGALLSFIDAAESLMNGTPVDHEDLLGFQTWEQVREVAGKDEGKDLRMMVNVVDQHKPDVLRAALKALPDETKADIVISTGHRAKGREWKRVRLCDDFLRGFRVTDPVKGTAAVSKAELMLLYVACTRARSELEVPPQLLGKLRDLEASQPAAQAAA
jgi:hypothetical protein